MKTLLIISDSGMSVRKDQTVAFGPVVKEVEAFLQLFDHITWIGSKQDFKGSFEMIPKERLTVQMLDRPSGSGWRYKIKILFQYPRLKRLLLKEIEKHQYIHVRAPSHPAYLAMRICRKFPTKQFWFKYAGSWVDPAPKFYDFQRRLLKSLPLNCKVTVNGEWPKQSANILSFENPCLSEVHREEGNKVLSLKSVANPPKMDYCFVGGLNENKGIEQIVRVWSQIHDKRIGTLHIVGEGPLKKVLLEMARTMENKISFHGLMPKEKVHQIYSQCHFIILPSKTEGFPKVIGEAMNYSCVPLVSNVSCLGQYIQNGVNGFLLKDRSVESIARAIHESLLLKSDIIHRYNHYNYNLAEKFTYTYYIQRIRKKIFNL